MDKKRLTLLLVLSLLLVLLLAACGAEETPTLEPTEILPVEEPVVEPTEVMPTEEPTHEEQIAVIAFHANPASLDPSVTNSDETMIFVNVYDTLTRIDSNNNAIPRLAESWEHNEDATEWTFHLRPGVKFHDGTDFDAEAVKFSIERTLEGGIVAALDPIDTIEVVDDLTVKFNLSAPFKLDVELGGLWTGGYIVSPTAVANNDATWFATGGQAGTGPYSIESIESGQRIILSRFDDYWGGWEGDHFDRVVFEIVEDSTVREQMMRSGEADFTLLLSYDSYQALEGVDGLYVNRVNGFQPFIVALNNMSPPLDNISVRQALSYSFPYDDIVAGSFGGLGSRMTSVVPSAVWRSEPEFSGYEFDLDMAQAMLQEAGIAEGTTLEIVILTEMDTDPVAEIWMAELAKIGIELEILPLAVDAVLARLADPTTAYDMFLLPWNTGGPNLHAALSQLFHSTDFVFPVSFYFNPEFDALVDEGLSLVLVDPDGAEALYAQAAQMLLDQAVAIGAVQVPDIAVSGERVGPYQLNPMYAVTVFWYEVSP